jgi:hypothetical protein
MVPTGRFLDKDKTMDNVEKHDILLMYYRHNIYILLT